MVAIRGQQHLTSASRPGRVQPYLLPFLIVFPLVNGYVVLRFRLLRTDYWVRQGIVYALLTFLWWLPMVCS
jgi:hypothetical protein